MYGWCWTSNQMEKHLKLIYEERKQNKSQVKVAVNNKGVLLGTVEIVH